MAPVFCWWRRFCAAWRDYVSLTPHSACYLRLYAVYLPDHLSARPITAREIQRVATARPLPGSLPRTTATAGPCLYGNDFCSAVLTRYWTPCPFLPYHAGVSIAGWAYVPDDCCGRLVPTTTVDGLFANRLRTSPFVCTIATFMPSTLPSSRLHPACTFNAVAICCHTT